MRYLHSALEPILKESLGVCIYQEQVLRIAEALAGFSWVEADLLRRLMTHQRSAEEMQRFRGEFIRACAERGIASATVEQIWQSLEKFAGFGFCKAHAATYADMAWRICCLKAHYPAEFMAAVCNSGAGFYHPAAYVEEARRMKLRVLPPCLNHSEAAYTAEQGALRIGLMQVKNLTARAMESLLEVRRAGGPFGSLEDFLRRVDAERSEVESLIKCGAFDCLREGFKSHRRGAEDAEEDAEGKSSLRFSPRSLRLCGENERPTRPELLWLLDRIYDRVARQKQERTGRLFPAPGAGAGAAGPEPSEEWERVPRLRDYGPEQKLDIEQEVLEVFASGHPLDFVRRNGELPARRIPEFVHRTVTCLGWLITYRRVGTKDLRNMMFLTFEDKTAVFEAVLFPDAYEKLGGLIFDTRLFRVTGRVERDGQINCTGLEPIT